MATSAADSPDVRAPRAPSKAIVGFNPETEKGVSRSFPEKAASKPATRTRSTVDKYRDIRTLIFIAHAIGYPLAVFAPIFIDPVLKSHVVYSTRQYQYAFLCIPIYFSLL